MASFATVGVVGARGLAQRGRKSLAKQYRANLEKLPGYTQADMAERYRRWRKEVESLCESMQNATLKKTNSQMPLEISSTSEDQNQLATILNYNGPRAESYFDSRRKYLCLEPTLERGGIEPATPEVFENQAERGWTWEDQKFEDRTVAGKTVRSWFDKDGILTELETGDFWGDVLEGLGRKRYQQGASSDMPMHLRLLYADAGGLTSQPDA